MVTVKDKTSGADAIKEMIRVKGAEVIRERLANYIDTLKIGRLLCTLLLLTVCITTHCMYYCSLYTSLLTVCTTHSIMYYNPLYTLLLTVCITTHCTYYYSGL